MRLLIVDDEEQIREGMKRFILKQKFPFKEIRTAVNGEDALRIFEEYDPDILMLDVVMPEIDGIQIANMCREIKKNIKIIMISGYGDYEYIKAAFKVNAVDYIMKPVDQMELRCVLEKVIEEIRKEKIDIEHRREMESRLKESLRLLREKLLYALLYGQYESISKGHINQKLLNISLSMKNRYTVILCDADNIGEGDLDLNNVKVLVDESFADYKKEIIVSSDNKLVLILDVSGLDCSNLWNRLYNIGSSIVNKCLEAYDTSFTISIGSVVNGFSRISLSYNQAVKSLNHRFILGYGQIIFYDQINLGQHESFVVPKEIRMESISIVKNGYFAGIDDLLKKMFEELYNAGGVSDEAVHKIKIEIIRFLSSIKEEFDQKHDLYDNQNQFDEFDLMSAQTLKEIENKIRTFFMEMIKYTTDIREKKYSQIIKKAVEIVDREYNKGLTVQYVADMINISPNYFSTLFKKEIKMNFTEYLTTIRLLKAEELMHDESMRISEISSMVGYDDQNYFTRIFKKRYGFTPTEYRRIKL